MTGLKWWGGALLTHRATVPVVCPPRPSETETVRRQLLQVLGGQRRGSELGGAGGGLVQEPAQEALQA